MNERLTKILDDLRVVDAEFDELGPTVKDFYTMGKLAHVSALVVVAIKRCEELLSDEVI